MRAILSIGIILASGATAAAADRPGSIRQAPAQTTASSSTTRSEPKWSFSLFPKSFQKNPVLDMTVYTELTEAGRAVTPPTPENPVYYEEFSVGYRHIGDGAEQNKPPGVEDLEAALRRSLAAAGYKPSEASGPPATLLILLHWGAHTGLDPMAVETNPTGALQNLHQRAALVGGDAFAAKLLQAHLDSADAGAVMEMLSPETAEFFNPVTRFREQDDSIRNLVEQATDDIYFVVASAYDYSLAARDERVLLWRTRMTVNTQGVSMRQTLPPLIAIASPYFGRETPTAVPIRKRGLPDGKVEFGEPTVVEVIEVPITGETANTDSAPVSADSRPPAAPSPPKNGQR